MPVEALQSRAPSNQLPLGEDMAMVRAAQEAEDSGDFAGALRLLRHLPTTPRRRVWSDQLAAVIALGPTPEPWRLACWLVHPALRRAVEQPGRSVLHDLSDVVLQAIRIPAARRAALAPECALGDPLVADAGLFDCGLFESYGSGISAVIRSLSGLVDWWGVPAGVHQMLSVDDHLVSLRCCDTGEVVTACCPRPWPGLVPGHLAYARPVPIEGPAPYALPLRPVVVDRLSAARVRRAIRRGAPLKERVRALAVGRQRAVEGQGR